MPDNTNGGEPKTPERTEHSIERGEQGRPVETAIPDAQRATQNDVFVQTSDGRWIVRGLKSREQIFLPDGRPHTTIPLRPKSAHQNLLKRGARRPATQAEFEKFKEFFK